jgi:hypothetical protein
VGARDENLGFRLVSLVRGEAGGLSTVARFQCVECGETHDLRVSSGRPLNAEGYAKRAQQDGWKADPWKRNRCWCPRCAGPRPKAAAIPNLEPGKVIPMAAHVAPIRDITAAQKQRIRALLDRHFDDSAGAYLDAMSDQKVAEAVGIPRVHVETLREAAYGPIRISPEMAEARAELEAVRKLLTDAKASIGDLERRVVAAEERVGRLAGSKAA